MPAFTSVSIDRYVRLGLKSVNLRITTLFVLLVAQVHSFVSVLFSTGCIRSCSQVALQRVWRARQVSCGYWHAAH